MSNAYVQYAYGSVLNSGNNLIDSLTWGSKWASSSGPLVIDVGYYPVVDKYNSLGVHTGSRAVTASELTAMQNTLAEFAKYINVTFNFIGKDDTETSDIQFVLSADKSTTNLGIADPPGEHSGNPNFSEVWVFPNNYSTSSGNLAPGGYDYITFFHEFGHAMGLAHPHDNGGTSSDPSQIMSGVTDAFGSYGDYGLNQGIYTTMSYNDGWQLGGLSQKVKTYGFQTGLMALDIQALQYIYGANTTYHTGDDDYALKTANAKGTGYTCIWDAGGTDTIRMTGTRGCVIDLRDATGQLGEGGGGFVSHAIGIRGGFTIAVGVSIENAVGGKGGDTIHGNEADNLITGGGGKDVMTGDFGADTFIFNAVGDSSYKLTSADVITDFAQGADHIDLHLMDASSVTKGLDHFTFLGAVAAFTAAGQIRYEIDALNDRTIVYLNTDKDAAAESTIILNHQLTLNEPDFILV